MITLSNLSLQFGGKYLFKDVNLRINSGDKYSLVGANGTGKSSLLKILSGELQPESGTIHKQKNISIGYLPQDHVTHAGRTLLDEASSALTDIKHLQQKEEIITNSLNKSVSEEERDDLVHQLGEIHHRLEELDSYSATSKVEKILTGLGFEENDFNRMTEEFSGGWQMRIALAKILISQNDVLLMDEPTNHLDIDSLSWLIYFLQSFEGALIIVSHDRNFINSVTDKTIELYLNKLSIFKGNFDAYLKFKDQRDEELIHKHQLQQKQIKETERFIERFRYKNTKAKQVQSRIKQLEKTERIELPESVDEIELSFPDAPPSGKVNIELQSLTKSYGSNVVLEDIDFTINRGDKIAFVGPNGAGKTTLSKIIAGILDFENGKRIVGHNTLISYYAQDIADDLNPDLDILDSVYGITNEKNIGQLRSLLGSFLFKGDDVFKKVSVLSGGEKSRVALCKLLLRKANLLILDEPTNHLDFSSKAVLQKALINFNGSLVIVSHDIDFLEPIVNKVTDIRNRNVTLYEGGIDYYFSKRESLLSETGNERENIQDKKDIRKDQKRREAELRQKKYKATKNLKEEILVIEKKITSLEKEEKELEKQLADNTIYNNVDLAKAISERFGIVKKELEDLMNKWTEISSKLMEIEEQYN